MAKPGNLAPKYSQRVEIMVATALTGLNIWNGEKKVAEDSIVFEGSKISSICFKDDVPNQAQEISCGGATALPGLIDAHVHMELDPNHTRPPEQTDLNQRPLMKERAKKMVEAGITTARDLGGGAWLEIELRNLIDEGAVLGPRLLCAGQPITCINGHCHFWGGEVADFQMAKAIIQRQIEHGADLIKIMATGGRMTKGSSPMDTQFDLNTLLSMVEEAKSHNRPVAAHCHGTAGIEMAARAGVSTIEHCSWVGKEGWGSDFQLDVARVIAKEGAWVSPTINKGWQRMLDNDDKTLAKRLKEIYQSMNALEIPLIASTDAGIPGVFHHHLPQALLVFSKLTGLGKENTLKSATSLAASAIGLAGSTGRLVAGFDADILLVDGDPTKDLQALESPVGVWTRGTTVRMP